MISFFDSNEKKARLHIAVGLGKTKIIINAVQCILQENQNVSVAVISRSRQICEQIEKTIRLADESISIASYSHDVLEKRINNA